MSKLKRKVAIFLTNHMFAGTRSWTFRIKRNLLIWGGIEIGENSKIVGPIFIFGKLKIGRNTWVGKNFIVNGNGYVEIGDNCDIAPEVTFQTGGHKIGLHDHRAGEGELYHQIVGNGVWIGGRSTILNNVSIGDGSVVAGCACVAKSVRQNVIVGGVPAREIKELS